MFGLGLIKIFNECKHDKVSYFVKASYCPDCGAYVENKFYIVRCSCCHIKRAGIIRGDNVLPKEPYCRNCGSDKFYIQELSSPTIFDTDYLVIKKEIKQLLRKRTSTQVWIETPQIIKPKLLFTNK